ncbi:MAG: hypothetical protein R3B91_07600 [Planctomycetaceae bacterium]
MTTLSIRLRFGWHALTPQAGEHVSKHASTHSDPAIAESDAMPPTKSALGKVAITLRRDERMKGHAPDKLAPVPAIATSRGAGSRATAIRRFGWHALTPQAGEHVSTPIHTP